MGIVPNSIKHSSSSNDLKECSVSLEKKSEKLSPAKEQDPKDGDYLNDMRKKKRKVEDLDPKDDDFLNDARKKKRKVEESESTENPQVSTLNKPLELTSEVSTEQKKCGHPGSIQGFCISCRAQLPEKYGLSFDYITEGLRLGNDEIDRLRRKYQQELLRDRKLCLVLDLDHTLLNATRLSEMTVEEEYLHTQKESMQGNLFQLQHQKILTKFRPFVHTFLKEASKMFEMYIYTMASQDYALEMTKRLDPTREYFSHRVISRDGSTKDTEKDLDLVLEEERTVLILDDTEDVWPKHKDNLILMFRYNYFAWSCHQFDIRDESLAEKKIDESDTQGPLAKILEVLKTIHAKFYHELGDNIGGRDVRQVMKMIRKEILKGCTIVFSDGFCNKFPDDFQHNWDMALEMGATCLKDTRKSRANTHMVLTDIGETHTWADKNKISLVNPHWIEESYYVWKRLPEKEFPLWNLH